MLEWHIPQQQRWLGPGAVVNALSVSLSPQKRQERGLFLQAWTVVSEDFVERGNREEDTEKRDRAWYNQYNSCFLWLFLSWTASYMCRYTEPHIESWQNQRFIWGWYECLLFCGTLSIERRHRPTPCSVRNVLLLAKWLTVGLGWRETGVHCSCICFCAARQFVYSGEAQGTGVVGHFLSVCRENRHVDLLGTPYFLSHSAL